MAYMNQEKKAKIATALKPILAKYKMKGTLRTRQHAITLTLRSGPVDFVQDLKYIPYVLYGLPIDKNEIYKHYCMNINQYNYKTNYEGVSAQFIGEVNDAMQAADYHDNSDAMTDYFDTGYYYDIAVGDWQKPYKVVA